MIHIRDVAKTESVLRVGINTFLLKELMFCVCMIGGETYVLRCSTMIPSRYSKSLWPAQKNTSSKGKLPCTDPLPRELPHDIISSMPGDITDIVNP